MIRISNIRLEVDETFDILKKKAANKLRVSPEALLDFHIVKQSLDARKREKPHFLYTVDVHLQGERKALSHIKSKDVTIAPVKSRRYPKEKISAPQRPVIVGFGPAGIFAALTMAHMGLRPIVLERGEEVDKRIEKVTSFWNNRILDAESNVQFGEGGAGTFSDGKLTSRTKDPRSCIVLEELVEAGAPEEILYSYRPHIGTDLLRMVVQKLREKIISLGGEIYFSTKVNDIIVQDGAIAAVVTNHNEKIETHDVIFAIGHSARDTFQMLYEKGVKMEQKPFAVGVRIEHKQKEIDIAQLGEAAEFLSPADYKLSVNTTEGRSVYTFCMCPGGHVVAAASEENSVVTNGMSYFARDGENANSALLVQVYPEDFGNNHALAGIEFQRKLEKKAFEAAGKNYSAPCETVGSFLNNQKNEIADVMPTYSPGVHFTNLNQVLPDFVCKAFKEAIPLLGKKLKGFDNPESILTAVESRSSSPVRVLRDGDSGESLSIQGIYPVGEGAGYAGGIVSAAIDGIAAAEKIYFKYKN